MTNIDRSSWVSWASFYLGFVLAWGPDMERDVRSLGPGALLMLACVAAFFLSVMLIQRYMRIALTSNTFGDPQQLVTGGVFRFSRNPIYLGFLLPLVSLAYFSPVASAIAIVVYLVAMTTYVISREERVLSELFGASFQDYRARTPRWLLV